MPQNPKQPAKMPVWGWVIVFGLMGILGWTVIARKHHRRSAQLERQQTAREDSWIRQLSNSDSQSNTPPGQSVADESDSFERRQQRVILWLAAIIATGGLVLVAGVYWAQRPKTPKQDTLPDQTKSDG